MAFLKFLKVARIASKQKHAFVFLSFWKANISIVQKDVVRQNDTVARITMTVKEMYL